MWTSLLILVASLCVINRGPSLIPLFDVTSIAAVSATVSVNVIDPSTVHGHGVTVDAIESTISSSANTLINQVSTVGLASAFAVRSPNHCCNNYCGKVKSGTGNSNFLFFLGFLSKNWIEAFGGRKEHRHIFEEKKTRYRSYGRLFQQQEQNLIEEKVSHLDLTDVSANSKNSVHLQLHQQSLKSEGDNHNEEEIEHSHDRNDDHIIDLKAYISQENGTILLGVLDSRLEVLERLWISQFKSSDALKVSPRDIKIVERKVSLLNSSELLELRKLWESERLLSCSKKYPVEVSSRTKKTFIDSVTSSVSRMKLLYRDKYNSTSDSSILGFLLQESINGKSITELKYDPNREFNSSVEVLREILKWFKDGFPYYYDNCQHCHQSRSNEYVGSMGPSRSEIFHLAGIVEVYSCRNCSQLTRFPRFNDVAKVIETRKGRCGEYSVLLLRMLELLGYKTRWVVDLADHVWVEARIADKNWIHCDPCEAAVDEPLIYQSWGKNITYIVAYDFEQSNAVDVTSSYTNDMELAWIRRSEEGHHNQSYIDDILAEASFNLTSYAKEIKSKYTSFL